MGKSFQQLKAEVPGAFAGCHPDYDRDAAFEGVPESVYPIEGNDSVSISWPPKIHAKTNGPIKWYPKSDKYEFQEFAGPVFEFGGYGDCTMIDPYTGRRFWVGNANFGPPGEDGRLPEVSTYAMIRKVLDLAEECDFLDGAKYEPTTEA